MSSLLILTIWVNIYVVFNIILFFSKMYKDYVEKKSKTICTGDLLNVRKDVKTVYEIYFWRLLYSKCRLEKTCISCEKKIKITVDSVL